jgi:hypothetical protein
MDLSTGIAILKLGKFDGIASHVGLAIEGCPERTLNPLSTRYRCVKRNRRSLKVSTSDFPLPSILSIAIDFVN